MRYFSNSTGTYWPFEIERLLKPSELESIVSLPHAGVSENVLPGSYIKDFPLRQKKFNRYQFLNVIYRIKLDRLLKKFRGEYVIEGKVKRLERVPKNAKAVTGVFPPI
jgi:hypothetical protein